MLAAVLAGCATRENATVPSNEEGVKSFALYTLSRGRGVPDEAREALANVRALLEEQQREGVAMTLGTTRIGLEGERKLCVEFEEQAAGGAAFQRAEEIVGGVDLVNLVVEPCGDRELETRSQGENP